MQTGLAYARPMARVTDKTDETPAGLVIKSYPELQASPMVVPAQVIEGVLYRAGKMIVGGTSKGRKTWSLMDLAAGLS